MATAPRPRSEAGDGSGVRRPVDPVGMIASGDRRGDSHRVRRLFVVVVGVGEDLEELVAGLDARYEVRFMENIVEARQEIAHQVPDVVILDEDADDQGSYDLLDDLSRVMRAPVVIVLYAATDRPSIAQMFGVPSVHKPVSADELHAAVEVAMDRNLRPVPRRMGE